VQSAPEDLPAGPARRVALRSEKQRFRFRENPALENRQKLDRQADGEPAVWPGIRRQIEAIIKSAVDPQGERQFPFRDAVASAARIGFDEACDDFARPFDAPDRRPPSRPQREIDTPPEARRTTGGRSRPMRGRPTPADSRPYTPGRESESSGCLLDVPFPRNQRVFGNSEDQ
jgi:hypothetical protein